VPAVVDSGLGLIGHATSGVALFVAGITIATSKIILNLEVGVNAILKMVVLPVFCFVLAALLSVKALFSYEGLLLSGVARAVADPYSGLARVLHRSSGRWTNRGLPRTGG
jgi:malonate transporter and related proteins